MNFLPNFPSISSAFNEAHQESIKASAFLSEISGVKEVLNIAKQSIERPLIVENPSDFDPNTSKQAIECIGLIEKTKSCSSQLEEIFSIKEPLLFLEEMESKNDLLKKSYDLITEIDLFLKNSGRAHVVVSSFFSWKEKEAYSFTELKEKKEEFHTRVVEAKKELEKFYPSYQKMVSFTRQFKAFFAQEKKEIEMIFSEEEIIEKMGHLFEKFDSLEKKAVETTIHPLWEGKKKGQEIDEEVFLHIEDWKKEFLEIVEETLIYSGFLEKNQIFFVKACFSIESLQEKMSDFYRNLLYPYLKKEDAPEEKTKKLWFPYFRGILEEKEEKESLFESDSKCISYGYYQLSKDLLFSQSFIIDDRDQMMKAFHAISNHKNLESTPELIENAIDFIILKMEKIGASFENRLKMHKIYKNMINNDFLWAMICKKEIKDWVKEYDQFFMQISGLIEPLFTLEKEGKGIDLQKVWDLREKIIDMPEKVSDFFDEARENLSFEVIEEKISTSSSLSEQETTSEEISELSENSKEIERWVGILREIQDMRHEIDKVLPKVEGSDSDSGTSDYFSVKEESLTEDYPL